MNKIHAIIITGGVCIALCMATVSLAMVLSNVTESGKTSQESIHPLQERQFTQEVDDIPRNERLLYDRIAESQIQFDRPDHPVIFVSFVSHNEDIYSPLYPNFLEDEEEFWKQRELVVEYANILHDAGVKYNFQTDWNFLLAIKEFDKGTEATNGKNLLRYLSEDLEFSIDPHSHQQGGYNFADVAYLIEELGVEPTGIIGGFTAIPEEEAIWEDYWKPIKGNKFNYSWTPTILWGGARPGHSGESEVWVSGIWRPKDESAYLEHDDDAPLVNVGGFQTKWEGLEILVEALEAGKLSSDQMYTISIMLNQHEMTDAVLEEYRETLSRYAQLAEEGYIEWVFLQDAVEIWEAHYGANGNITLYSELTTDGTTLPSRSQSPLERPLQREPDPNFQRR